jgi:hypothetical protein
MADAEVRLSEVLAALRDAQAWDRWIGENWGPGWPRDVRPIQAAIAADYLAARFSASDADA